MSEKVKLPKDVCDALDYALYERKLGQVYVLECVERAYFHDAKLEKLAEQDALEIMQALVLGYEPELSAEELTMQLWNKSGGYVKDGIRDALLIHGIRYDWMGSE